MSWWKKASRKEPQARAFGFTNELPFMGSAWWILVLLVFLILVALCYLAITNLIRRKLEKYDTGRILIDDVEIEKIGHARYLRDYVSFLFQNFALIENKTVKQNLSIIKKKNRSGMSIKEALERVGMLDKLNTKVYKLSGGEQQRVALARVLLKKSKIVLADEPTGSLDEENARIVIDILKKMSEEGKTVIMVSHNKDYLQEASKVIYL